MTKTTKILIAVALLIAALSVNGQINCVVVCHNDAAVRVFDQHALNGHLGHGDVFITNDCEFIENGTDCDTLSLPKLDFTQPIEEGFSYYISDLYGRIYKVGKTDETLFKTLPKGGVFFIKVEGYQSKKILRL